KYRSEAAWALSGYASALEGLGRTEEALAAYNAAIEFLPDSPPLLRNRSEILIHLRRLDAAERDLERAVELDSNENSPYLWFHRAQLAIARGDPRRANQMLAEVVNRDPTYDESAVAFLRSQAAWLNDHLNEAK